MPKAKSTPQERLNAAVERYLKASGMRVLAVTNTAIESTAADPPFTNRLVVTFLGKSK